MSADGSAGRSSALADALHRAGYLTEDRWRDALRAAPRHLFCPDAAVAVPADGSPRYAIDRQAAPEVWWDAVYSDTAIVTQLDDGHTDLANGQGDYTSSASAPGMVAAFLELLDPYPGDRVLEIGTGTGWTSALLSAVLGAEHVTSVEVDAEIAGRAAANLDRAGFAPALVVGDGAAGWAQGAPYDGVHATCGVHTIPYPWLAQTRPAGTIVAPWMPGIGHGHQLRLRVTPDCSAVGRFAGGSSYMMLRAQRPPAPCFDDGDGWRESSTLLDPRRIAYAPSGAHTAIAALVPGLNAHSKDSEDDSCQLWLWTPTSQARIAYAPGYTHSGVQQRGPRDLWKETTNAFFAWVDSGSPATQRLGLTITPETQDPTRLWIDTPQAGLRSTPPNSKARLSRSEAPR